MDNRNQRIWLVLTPEAGWNLEPNSHFGVGLFHVEYPASAFEILEMRSDGGLAAVFQPVVTDGAAHCVIAGTGVAGEVALAKQEHKQLERLRRHGFGEDAVWDRESVFFDAHKEARRDTTSAGVLYQSTDWPVWHVALAKVERSFAAVVSRGTATLALARVWVNG